MKFLYINREKMFFLDNKSLFYLILVGWVLDDLNPNIMTNMRRT
jgi:hypothetical protein